LRPLRRVGRTVLRRRYVRKRHARVHGCGGLRHVRRRDGAVLRGPSVWGRRLLRPWRLHRARDHVHERHDMRRAALLSRSS
jgi:hypothetical protein